MSKKEFSLYQGDSLIEIKNIPDGSVDMILTDPPYGTTACKWDSIIPLEPMWEQLKRIIKPNGAIVMTASQPFTTTLISSNMNMFKYSWVWEKSKATGYLNSKKRPLVAHEDVLVFYNKQPTYNPQKTNGKPYNKGKALRETGVYGSQKEILVKNIDGKRYPRTVQYFKTAESEGKTIHPTQKPVALMEYLIKTYTNENETVLDFAMGSATTGVACKNLNRNFIGIELDKEYFEIAKNRINKTDY
jgi:site-specific DNA-methyltransferase (adenine-specific)